MQRIDNVGRSSNLYQEDNAEDCNYSVQWRVVLLLHKSTDTDYIF